MAAAVTTTIALKILDYHARHCLCNNRSLVNLCGSSSYKDLVATAASRATPTNDTVDFL